MGRGGCSIYGVVVKVVKVMKLLEVTACIGVSGGQIH